MSTAKLEIYTRTFCGLSLRFFSVLEHYYFVFLVCKEAWAGKTKEKNMRSIITKGSYKKE